MDADASAAHSVQAQDEHHLGKGYHALLGVDHNSEITSLRSLVTQLTERVAFLESSSTTPPTSRASVACQTEPVADHVKRSPSPLRSYPLHDLLPEPLKKEEVKDESGRLRPRKRVKMEAVVIPMRRLDTHRRNETRAVVRVSPAIGDIVNPRARTEVSSSLLHDSETHDAVPLEDVPAVDVPMAGPLIAHIKDEPDEDLVLDTLPLYKRRTTTLADVKTKKDSAFDDLTVHSRLAAAGIKPFRVTLDPAIADIVVTRDFMSKTFGGPPQGTFPPIAAERVREHGYDDFMYLSLNFNPNAPHLPGEAGLFFISNNAEGQTAIKKRVLIRRRENEWLYVGQYRISPATSLTQREWLLQSSKVRSTWAYMILHRVWGSTVRATIALRREKGREPTKKEIEEAKNSSDQRHSLTQEEIMAAFDRGEQFLGVSTMECIEHDTAFQKQLAREFPLFQKEQATSIPVVPKKVQRKRKVRPAESDVSVRDESLGLGDDEEFPEFVPHGTRSRPRLST